ncbi:MAG: TIGR04282 family arsenosugar biosynthesis glycosyltransferase [Paracoccaceae bacterium]
MRRTLVVMVKVPRPGRVKTRLGRDMGQIDATWWFRHQSCELIRKLRDPRWQIVLAVAPDAEGMTARVWPNDIPRIRQGRGTLGDRMVRAFRRMPSGPVCIIGADIPGINRARVARAFRALGSADAVFGPAMDGGYWLVGLKRVAREPVGLFRNVRWSTEHALADSEATLTGYCISHVDRLRDIDTLADLRAAKCDGKDCA